MQFAKFDCSLDYKKLDLRKSPDLYRTGMGEQGVLLVEPYKSEILPHWTFKSPDLARKSSRKIYTLFKEYLTTDDFYQVWQKAKNNKKYQSLLGEHNNAKHSPTKSSTTIICKKISSFIPSHVMLDRQPIRPIHLVTLRKLIDRCHLLIL